MQEYSLNLHKSRCYSKIADNLTRTSHHPIKLVFFPYILAIIQLK